MSQQNVYKWPDDHRDFNWWPKHQQNQGNGAWKSSIEGSFGPQKSQIAFGAETCFLTIKASTNKEYYLSVMRHLREAIRKKRRELWANNSPQPPYSPDLAPCDFWLFPKLKRALRGNRFESIEEIERETVRALKVILTLRHSNHVIDFYHYKILYFLTERFISS